ncbi:MAG: DUF805 domain-containing protein [Alphaproteobacteria bacterium]
MTWKGRAPRSEFWFFVLFAWLIYIVAIIVDNVLGSSFKMGGVSIGYGWAYSLAALGLFLPNLAVMVRRLHDTNHSGWWYWIALVPLLGAILLLVWFCTKGTTGENRFGSDPLGPSAEVFS